MSASKVPGTYAGNGGAREGAGRPSKDRQAKLIEKLSPHEDEIIAIIVEKAKTGQKDFVKMYMEYLHGRPTQTVQLDGQLLTGTVPIDKWLDDNTSQEPIP